jgi:hypothetical protein
MRRAVRAGLHPSWLGFRAVLSETLREYFERRPGAARIQEIHPPATARHPLPFNVGDPRQLPDDAGWWGYSFRQVPCRRSDETLLASLPNVTVVPHVDANREFWVALLTEDQRALKLREITFRPCHARVLRQAPVEKLDRATWLLERVYHNYSHWLTAHLPKFVLLRDLGLTGEIVLPEVRPRFIDDSLQLLGLDPAKFRTFTPQRVYRVGELTVLSTDRFRPELLQPVRAAYPMLGDTSRRRRVYISREGALRRRLLNESEVWRRLEPLGFERVRMEELSFAEQIQLMQETAVLCAPHGAGLTNMMFCRPRTMVIEMADLGFPNPNFYALASAMNLRYAVVPAEGVGAMHPLEKDLRADLAALERALRMADLEGGKPA